MTIKSAFKKTVNWLKVPENAGAAIYATAGAIALTITLLHPSDESARPALHERLFTPSTPAPH